MLAAVRSAFDEQGLTIRAWAKERGFPPDLVYAVLSGRIKGCRGQSHQIAVSLGLKPDASASWLKANGKDSRSEST
jgi:gp16 family phage-associated protein